MVDRRVALVDLYARQLLVKLDADIERLDAVVAESRREADYTRTLQWSRDTARQRIIEAGAEHDPKGRDRLLASTNHTLTSEILGIFLPPEAHQQRAAELAETLDEIDQRPESDRWQRPGDLSDQVGGCTSASNASAGRRTTSTPSAPRNSPARRTSRPTAPARWGWRARPERSTSR